MRIVKKCAAVAVILTCIMNLLAVYVFAESSDSEGWRKTLEIEEPIYDTAVTIGIDIIKKAEVSFAIQFMTSDDSGYVKSIATVRLSAVGKLLFRDNGGWISETDENAASLVKSDFIANQKYNLKMKFTIKSGLIEWYLDEIKIGQSVTDVTGKPCEHIRLMSTEANMNNLEWQLESVTDENRDTAVLGKYSPNLKGVQGTNNWYFTEFGIDEVRNLVLSDDQTKWNGDGSYPCINRINNDILPASEIAVGFTFVAPETGMIRLNGSACMPYNTSTGADVTASIYKGRRKIWSEVVKYATDASYYYTIPIEKGEKLYFKIDSNGSNSRDWTHWTPSVEYLDIDYDPEPEMYTYFQKKNGVLTELSYDKERKCYVADDSIAYISNSEIRPSTEYSLVKRYTVQKDGRYRIYGEFGICNTEMTVTVMKNQEIIWQQLLPAGENGVLDVRALSKIGDDLDIEVSSSDCTEDVCTISDLYIEYHVGTAFCRASTAVGDSYNTLDELSLGELVVNPGDVKVEFYSKRFSRQLNMRYDSTDSKWVSCIPDDTGYFTAAAAYPGKHYDSVMEITVPKSGILNIKGDMSVRDISDGVVSKISLNNEVIWSSRIGGERPVRWDEPYDVSYFLNSVDVTANVKKGDKLAFSFNQWRLINNDKVDISNVILKYISKDVLSETTKWKLDKSTVVDTQKKTVQANGANEGLDVIVKTGITYIAKTDLAKVFGDGFVTSEESVTISGKEYMPLRSIAESDGKTVVWAADKLAIIHSGIPVLFGWNELSEIRAAYASDSPREVYRCFDTYESGTTPAISLTDSNSDIAFQYMGGLKPQKGYAEIAEQSNAMVLEYEGNENISSNTSRIKISDYVDDTKSNIIGFDIFIPSPCSFEFSLLDNKGTEGIQFFVSANGWIGPCYGIDTNAQERMDLWINRSLSDVLSDSNFTGTQFEFGIWNNIKLIYDMPNRLYHLYLNDKLVQTVTEKNLLSQDWKWDISGHDSLQITNYSAQGGMKIPLYLDNMLIGNTEYFIPRTQLNDASLSAMAVTLSDTFEEDDLQDIITAWSGDNQLRPLGGNARKLVQSNAARIFSGKTGESTEHIRFDVRNYVGDGSMPVAIEFDINLFSDEIFVFSDRKYWGYGQQAIVSPNGYIAAAFGKWIDNDEQYAAIRTFAARTRDEQAEKGVETADFQLNTWHNVKMLYEDGGSKRSLYVDGRLVCVWTGTAESALEAFQITMLTNENNLEGNALFDIDNLKILQLNKFYIHNFYAENQSGMRIDSFVPGETCYVKLSAENNNSFDENMQLFIAQYEGEKLVDVLVSGKLTVSEDGGEFNIGSASGEDAVSFAAHDNADRILIYLWNGTAEMKPVAEAVSIVKESDDSVGEGQ